MEDIYRILQYDELNFGFWITKRDRSEHSGFHPSHVLFYVLQGTLNLRLANKIMQFEAGKMVFVKKHFLGYYSKSWTEQEKYSEAQAIIFQDKFIKDILEEMRVPNQENKPADQPFFEISPNATLVNLFKDLRGLFEENNSITENHAREKTKQAILGLIEEDPRYINTFTWIIDESRTSLTKFIDHHFLLGKPVEELAKLSGRSLSTFYREFHQEYGEAPAKWLMKRRMNHAFEQVKNTSLSLTKIAYSCGFQDLSHFGKSFKKHFGKSPSSFRGS